MTSKVQTFFKNRYKHAVSKKRKRKEVMFEQLKLNLSNFIMLGIIILILFILPLFQFSYNSQAFNIGISLIIVLSVIATSQHFNISHSLQVMLSIIAIWIGWFTMHELTNTIACFVLFSFFISRVFVFIKQLYIKKDVTSLVIVESINGYLLLGIAFGLLVEMIIITHPQSFNFEYINHLNNYYDPYYYSFVTMLTLGYGDLLPITSATKSISILICLSGQLYLVTVMAMLISRFKHTHKDSQTE